jgi:hypothetical protein
VYWYVSICIDMFMYVFMQANRSLELPACAIALPKGDVALKSGKIKVSPSYLRKTRNDTVSGNHC